MLVLVLLSVCVFVCVFFLHGTVKSGLENHARDKCQQHLPVSERCARTGFSYRVFEGESYRVVVLFNLTAGQQNEEFRTCAQA